MSSADFATSSLVRYGCLPEAGGRLQPVSIDELDGRSPVPTRFSPRIPCERSGGDEQTPFATTSHRTPEVADGTRSDGPLVALALEVHGKGHEGQPVGAESVYTAVAALARHQDVDEASLAKDPLRKSLEPVC